jgi:hypothetical protein
MAMDAVEVWRQCFQQWPDDVARRGVVVASFGEQIPFDGFSASDQMVLIERRAPDTVGARMVLIPYQNIVALKIVDVIKAKAFTHLGFSAPPPKK